jgi:hypothetical protein
MKQSTKSGKTEKEKQEDLIKKVWDKPVGKIGMTAVCILGIALFRCDY